MEILSSREWASVIWGVAFFVYAMSCKEVRKSFWLVMKLFFGSKLVILFGIIMFYVFVITIIFYHLPFWDNSYIKDIVVWFIFSGLIYCMNSVSRKKDDKYITTILKDNLKLIIILEFIVNTFTFNIWVELIILPVITMITIMSTFAERKEEYKKVHKLLDFIISIIGIWMLYGAIKIGINEYNKVNISNILISFIIPIIYLILIVPLIYLIELSSKYEGLFLVIFFKEGRNKKKQREHFWKIIKICRFSMSKVSLFEKKYLHKIYPEMCEGEFEILLNEFKDEYNSKNL